MGQNEGPQADCGGGGKARESVGTASANPCLLRSLMIPTPKAGIRPELTTEQVQRLSRGTQGLRFFHQISLNQGGRQGWGQQANEHAAGDGHTLWHFGRRSRKCKF